MRLPRWLEEWRKIPNAVCYRCGVRFPEDFVGLLLYSAVFNVLCRGCWSAVTSEKGAYSKWVMTAGTGNDPAPPPRGEPESWGER